MAGPNELDEVMIGALLAIPALELRRRGVSELKEEGFADYRPTHQAVFQWLGPDGDRVTDLAERVGMTRQSMAELIDYLEERGYVERFPDPTDRRAQLVRRTERGWAVNRVARRVVEAAQAEWAQALGNEDFETLMRLLRRLAGVVNAGAGAAGHPRTETAGHGAGRKGRDRL
jgi:DNA-binding MarR family transcriptional regulator